MGPRFFLFQTRYCRALQLHTITSIICDMQNKRHSFACNTELIHIFIKKSWLLFHVCVLGYTAAAHYLNEPKENQNQTLILSVFLTPERTVCSWALLSRSKPQCDLIIGWKTSQNDYPLPGVMSGAFCIFSCLLLLTRECQGDAST